LPTDAAGNLISEPTEIQWKPVHFTSLSETEREEYRQMQRNFECDGAKYDRCREALGKIRTKIQNSVAVENLHYTFDCNSVYVMLLKPNKRFAPTDTIKEYELMLAWKAMQKFPKGQDIMAWLGK
jgi:hypothetical protein